MTTPLPRPIPSPAGQPLQASDAELAARAAGGDRSAFELIMRRHNRRLFRLARSLVRSDEEAEDVLQEAYVRAFARVRDLASGGALGAWLARIVANEALGRLRAGARVVSIEDFQTRAATDEEDGLDGDPASDAPDP